MRFAGVLVLMLLALVTTSGSAQNPRANSGAAISSEVLVKFRPGTGATARTEAHRLAGGSLRAEVARTGVQLVTVRAGDESAAIARYQRNPNVLYAEPHFVRTIPQPLAHGTGTEPVARDSYFDEQYALHNVGQQIYCIAWIDGELCLYSTTPDADIDAPEAWAISTGSPDVRVAVIDSGIDYNHPDLVGSYVGGYDFFTNDPDPMDDHGHGTHVAGTIAASLNNLTGTPGKEEGVVGVAPDVRLLAYKVCGVDGSCTDFAIQQAIARAIDENAKVINMSLGSTSYSQSLDDAVQDAWRAGLVIVAGAGNNGVTDLFYPAASSNVISVAAFDEDHRRASFSNYGSWVDISAPGNVIMSTYPLAGCAGAAPVPGDSGCYNWMSGTSMATPHVSGAAALVWSRGDVTTNSQVVDAILQSADPRGVASTRLDSWTLNGGLNIHDALSYGATNRPPIADAGGPYSGTVEQVVTFDGRASSDPDSDALVYTWDFGDGAKGTGATPTHAYAQAGDYTVALTVDDQRGGTNTAFTTAAITPVDQPVPDTVVVTKSAYSNKRGELTVEAASSGAPGVTLTAFDNTSVGDPVFIGTLTYNARKGRYSGTFSWPTRPVSIRVSSTGGGSATSSVGGR